jgi:hypothetical protein
MSNSNFDQGFGSSYPGNQPFGNQNASPYASPYASPNLPQGICPPNYLVQAILCTLFCCLPFGIVAIVFSAQVNGKWQTGQYQDAQRTSEQAKMWCWIAFGIGMLQIVVFVFLYILLAMSAMHGPGMRHF